MSERQVKCNRCGHIGPESEFPKGRDFFQNAYIRACPTGCGKPERTGTREKETAMSKITSGEWTAECVVTLDAVEDVINKAKLGW